MSAGPLTKPGTNLRLGSTAYVPYDTFKSNGQPGPTYTFAITVSAIKTGSMSDFTGVSLSGVPKGSVPYYVTMSITNVGKTGLKSATGDPSASMGVVETAGLDSSLILTGNFTPCPQPESPTVYEPGQAFNTCEIFMEKKPVTQIGYDGSSAMLDTPVTWSN